MPSYEDEEFILMISRKELIIRRNVECHYKQYVRAKVCNCAKSPAEYPMVAKLWSVSGINYLTCRETNLGTYYSHCTVHVWHCEESDHFFRSISPHILVCRPWVHVTVDSIWDENDTLLVNMSLHKGNPLKKRQGTIGSLVVVVANVVNMCSKAVILINLIHSSRRHGCCWAKVHFWLIIFGKGSW